MLYKIQFLKIVVYCGSANGNRTRDFALRGRRLSRLTIAPENKMAPGLGLEPRLNDPESLVLPLHHPGVYVLTNKMYYNSLI